MNEVKFALPCLLEFAIWSLLVMVAAYSQQIIYAKFPSNNGLTSFYSNATVMPCDVRLCKAFSVVTCLVVVIGDECIKKPPDNFCAKNKAQSPWKGLGQWKFSGRDSWCLFKFYFDLQVAFCGKHLAKQTLEYFVLCRTPLNLWSRGQKCLFCIMCSQVEWTQKRSLP